jgi:hypothetical protein
MISSARPSAKYSTPPLVGHVYKGEHGDGGFVREGEGHLFGICLMPFICSFHNALIHQRPVHPHRPADVLDLLFAKIVPMKGQFVFNLLEDTTGDVYATRVGQRLQPRCDVHPVAVDPLALLDHVPQVDPNAKEHAAVFGKLGVPRLQLFLHRHRALHRIHHTGELSQQVVAGRIHHAAPVLLDEVGEYLLVGFEGPDGGGLIVLHQATVAGDICAQDGGELAVVAL